MIKNTRQISLNWLFSLDFKIRAVVKCFIVEI
jgi:hypothetical protein